MPVLALRRSVAIAVVAGVALSGCVQAAADPTAGTVEPLAADVLPSTVLDLSVELENLDETLSALNRPYIDGVGLYSFRDDEDVLQATLQLSTFTDPGALDDDDFRGRILAQIGTTTVREFRMDDQQVWLTAGTQQNLAVWFPNNAFAVLATREDYEQPRRLLRELLNMELNP